MYTEDWNSCSLANPDQYSQYRWKYLCRCCVVAEVGVQRLVGVRVEVEVGVVDFLFVGCLTNFLELSD